jgi:antitoxin (DNA-binding transcriptional repressor) of toxin-antitoxin stability system
MRTLTVDEATAGLGKWLELALAGEEIQIRKGDAIVELRPAAVARPAPAKNSLPPREALRRLQQDARLTTADAESYLHEVRGERLAAEDRRPA